MKNSLEAAYARRAARLNQLVSEAGGDLELIAYYHELHAAWLRAVCDDTVAEREAAYQASLKG